MDNSEQYPGEATDPAAGMVAGQPQVGGTDPHRVLDGPVVPGPAGYLPGKPVPGEVVAYFGDESRRLYQLLQWLPVFERLDARHSVVIATRDAGTYAEVRRRTTLRAALAPALPDLTSLYEGSDFKLAVYVNNSMRNFQSLMAGRMLHVHLNHGESDKRCMVSNQVKAYDRVFVAGDAAVYRHQTSLIGFDEAKLVRVGRPQLDLRPPGVLSPTDRRTVLYAPTWEGETASDDYTSVDNYGPAIVRAALELPEVRFVYKPHPRVALSPDPDVLAGHRQILQQLAEATHRDPEAGHLALTEGDILAVFPCCDLLIADVSSVGPDFLYLRPDKPLFITNRRHAPQRLFTEVPISRCADVIDSSTVAVLGRTLAARLAHDEHRPTRDAMRRYYFGDLAPGESTERFLSAIDDAIADRNRLIGLRDASAAGERRVESS